MLNVLDERNRNKLYDILASGALCMAAGTCAVEDGIVGRRWTVESATQAGTDYTVMQVQHWDLSNSWSCTCPWGLNHGPFGKSAEQPCKHCLLAWYNSLPDEVQIYLLTLDAGLAHANRLGAAQVWTTPASLARS